MNTLGLGGAQLHGREPLSDVRWIRQRVPFVIQAFAAGDPALAAVGNGPADIVLVDADDPGSGKVFDWALADARARAVCGCCSRAASTPRTSREAIRRVRPWGVDVATGVETTPGSGRKDAAQAPALHRATARDAGDERSAATAGSPDPRARRRTTGWPTAPDVRTMTR